MAVTMSSFSSMPKTKVHLLNASRTDVAGVWMSAATLFAQSAIAATQQKNAIAFSMYRISIANSLLNILLFLSFLFEKFLIVTIHQVTQGMTHQNLEYDKDFHHTHFFPHIAPMTNKPSALPQIGIAVGAIARTLAVKTPNTTTVVITLSTNSIFILSPCFFRFLVLMELA